MAEGLRGDADQRPHVIFRAPAVPVHDVQHAVFQTARGVLLARREIAQRPQRIRSYVAAHEP